MAVPVLLGLLYRRAPRSAGMASILWAVVTVLPSPPRDRPFSPALAGLLVGCAVATHRIALPQCLIEPAIGRHLLNKT